MPIKKIQDTAEFSRLSLIPTGKMQPWRQWGAYVAERAWGTVREDYSSDGEAWDYFPHDMARSRAYRWGDDGIAGFCDVYQQLMFAFAFWNGHDPILKERLFGLTTFQGNHGEDVKEYYYYLDATPSCSYMRYLYKYPQQAYPYSQLMNVNTRRGQNEPEFELMDTGIFKENRYFDIQIEYAKAAPDDTCIRLEITNRGPESAKIHVLPHLWFRNRWTWHPEIPRPTIITGPASPGYMSLVADPTVLPPPLLQVHDLNYQLPKYMLYGPTNAALLFTENETNYQKLWGTKAKIHTPYAKDAFHRYVIDDEKDAINPAHRGSKACFHYSSLEIAPSQSVVLRMRLSARSLLEPLNDIDAVVAARHKDADEFYGALHSPQASEEEKAIQRQALAGMIWSQQFYCYNVKTWLEGDDKAAPPPDHRGIIRNGHWRHFNAIQTVSMPDKWEYPWFTAWDSPFHCVSLALVDINTAKENLLFLVEEERQHSSGQLPAYEWEFSEVNPPVQAWALWRLHQLEQKKWGRSDREFLTRCFHKLLINFDWWTNKVDRLGNNLFEGGFLGLDNISVIDRSKPLPGGGTIEQSDGTGWMGLFTLNMMRISLELAKYDPVYEHLAIKFFDNFITISEALHASVNRTLQMWDNEDRFFYDVLFHPDGTQEHLKIRSLVGIIPLFAMEFLPASELQNFQKFNEHFLWTRKFSYNNAERCLEDIDNPQKKGCFFSLLAPEQCNDILKRVWDPNEFRSLFGLRSLSKFHEPHPFYFMGNQVRYEPGESFERIKGGNSNWRGPIWFPINFLLIDALKKLDDVFGKDMVIETPQEAPVTAKQMAIYFAKALVSLFTRKADGKIPCHGDEELYMNDPHFRDLILFYEHFHGDTGRGLGASHQTGWTGLIANLIDELYEP